MIFSLQKLISLLMTSAVDNIYVAHDFTGHLSLRIILLFDRIESACLPVEKSKPKIFFYSNPYQIVLLSRPLTGRSCTINICCVSNVLKSVEVLVSDLEGIWVGEHQRSVKLPRNFNHYNHVAICG